MNSGRVNNVKRIQLEIKHSISSTADGVQRDDHAEEIEQIIHSEKAIATDGIKQVLVTISDN